MLQDRDIELRDALQQHGVITDSELNRATSVCKQSNHRLEDTLLELGLLSEDVLAQFLAQWLQLPVFEATDFTLEPEQINKLDIKYLQRIQAAPVSYDENGLTLAMVDPRNPEVIQALSFHLGLNVHVGVAAARTITSALEQTISKPETKITTAAKSDLERLEASANNGPVVQLVKDIITEAVDLGASDIHIEALETQAQVRLRIDGLLSHSRFLTDKDRHAGVSRLKIMANLNISERRRPQDGRIRLTVRGKSIDLRLSTLPTQFGESVVLRVLDQTRLKLDWDDLGFSSHQVGKLEGLIHAPNGIVLVTGPTGSGKTTTLYTALSRINSGNRKIITVEDPIEYSLNGINQVQVQPEIGFGFAEALRSVLRQDPDVVMLGEIRDAETAENAVRAALMGRLVLSTVHTNSAIAAIDRLSDLGIPSFLLSATLRGIVSQRLVRKLCQECSGSGCPNCSETGYSGRAVISEILEVNTEVAHHISEGAISQKLADLVQTQGMKTIRESAQELVEIGITDTLEVSRVIGEV